LSKVVAAKQMPLPERMGESPIQAAATPWTTVPELWHNELHGSLRNLYLNVHMGDLFQSDGATGSRRYDASRRIHRHANGREEAWMILRVSTSRVLSGAFCSGS